MPRYYVFVSHGQDGLTANMGERDYVDASTATEAAEAFATLCADAGDLAGYRVTAFLLADDGSDTGTFGEEGVDWATATVEGEQA